MANKEYKRLMTPADDKHALFLEELLDRDTTTYDDKLAIIEWFENFDYLTGKETHVDHILRAAGKLKW